jgi:hypothetical protein
VKNNKKKFPKSNAAGIFKVLIPIEKNLYQEVYMNLKTIKHKKKNRYNFHFVMDTDMINGLKELDLYNKTRSFSDLIVTIFSKLAPGLENKYFYGKQMESRYELVSDKPENPRKHIHVYMPHYLYRQLKLLHQDLNYYSIAQLVRNFLRFFLDLVKEFGENYHEELLNILNKWEKENSKRQFTRRSYKQLLQFIQKNSSIVRLLTVYSTIYTSIKKYRL